MRKIKKDQISPVIDAKSYIEAGKAFELFFNYGKNNNKKKKNG